MTISSTGSPRTGRPTRPRLTPPPDDPLLRHEENNEDRRYGSEGKNLTSLRLAAMRQSLTLPQLGPVPPATGTSNWVQMGPMAIPNGQTYGGSRVQVTGRISAIAIDPANSNTIYAGAAQGGVWKSTDAGQSWAPMSDNEVSLATGALAIDPTNTQVLYACTGEGNFSQDSYYGNGILKSTNGGSSWTVLGATVFAGARFCRLVLNPITPTTLFAATNFGLFRSTDAGVTWAQMTNGLPAVGGSVRGATDVVINPSAPDTVTVAVWGAGLYRSTNAGAPNPTWTQLTSGLPLAGSAAPAGFLRVALGISHSSPQTLYALFCNNDTTSPPPGPPYRYAIDRFYVSTDGGTTWNSVALPSGPGVGLGGQGFYNLGVAVDPTTPDIVYLSATSLWKAVRNPLTSMWTITDIGGAFHPDNHALTFDPSNHLVIYAGSDGGIYKSTDGGATWSDRINQGLCIAQLEFIDQHPTSDAVVFTGTQDNGTEQYRNSPVFYHADDGDGGWVAVDQTSPRNVLSTYYGLSPKRSTTGGAFGSWADLSSGLSSGSLFYPPLTLDETNQQNAAIGADRVYLDSIQGAGGWPTQVMLPGLTLNEYVSVISYVTSNLLYAATNSGKVYRLSKTGGTWAAVAIHATPLPARWIWEILPQPGNPLVVFLVMSGFGTAHVWRGSVPAVGPAAWTDVSGTGSGRLPDIPVNALAIEPTAPNTMYVASDIAVFRTTDGGASWSQFSDGLPNCAVFDMSLHNASRLLRVATHGRGMWERRLDVPAMADADIFVRDEAMDTGRTVPSPSGMVAAFDDPLQYVSLGDQVWWFQCYDVKVDALEGSPLAYQMAASDVDYVAFESKLQHRNAQRGRVNRVYVQAHNRGIHAASNVNVKVLYAAASAGLPPLAADFWTAFPADPVSPSAWNSIGPAKSIPSLSPTQPAILEWDWSTPSTQADHSCLLVVIDSADDPIPAANKVLDVNTLVSNEKRVGLKNLHVVSAIPGSQYWTPFQIWGDKESHSNIRIGPAEVRGWRLGFVLPAGFEQKPDLVGISRQEPSQAMVASLRDRVGDQISQWDVSVVYLVADLSKGGALTGLSMPSGQLSMMLLLAPPKVATRVGKVTIIQESDKGVPIGGSTFVLKAFRAERKRKGRP